MLYACKEVVLAVKSRVLRPPRPQGKKRGEKREEGM